MADDSSDMDQGEAAGDPRSGYVTPPIHVEVENDDISVTSDDPQDSYAARVALGLEPSLDRQPAIAQGEHFTSDNEAPERPCTAYFKPQSYHTADEIFEALEKEKFPATCIRCLQRRPTGEVLITFCNQAWRDSFLKHSSFILRKERIVTNDHDNPLVFLTIYDAPYELSDALIEKRLENYCTVVYARRGKHHNHPHVHNGLRHFRVRPFAAIPTYLRFGRFLLRLSHDGQEATCRKCNRAGHFAASCSKSCVLIYCQVYCW